MSMDIYRIAYQKCLWKICNFISKFEWYNCGVIFWNWIWLFGI